MCDIDIIRHTLHANPGLSGSEQYAHDIIVGTLRELSPTELHEHVGGYGVVAFWGDKSKPCIALRADTDALPIAESDALPYASTNAGVSHKCGHDGHTAILLRLAQLAHQENVTQLLLVFQPEEETGLGSKKILGSSILGQYNISRFFALHNLPGYALGHVVLCNNTFAAASTGIIYKLQGRQTHASTPEKGINPGLCTAAIIKRFATLSTGEDVAFDQFRQSTLICVRLGNEAFGTSAGSAEIMFTLRAFTNSTMRQLLSCANSIVAEETERYGLTFTTEQREPFNATENDAATVGLLRQMLVSEGYDIVEKTAPFRWSEDFADYLMQYRGAMFGIGAGTDHAELHHPRYDYPDALTEPAARLFLAIAKHFSTRL